MERIFLLEDDAALARGIALALDAPEREVELAHTLAQAESALQRRFDLMILDVNLPDGSGVDLLRRLRAQGERVPVILLTANDLELDEVTGLEAGADDYVTKPFSLAVLRARVAAQLRRGAPEGGEVYALGPFRFDFGRMDFRRGGDAVELSRTEQRLLRLLVENRGQTLPRALLMERIWPDGAAFVEENALSVAVKRLRDKLGAQAYIRTVYGIGYVWEAQP